MKYEYVKFDVSEQISSQKNLLQTQLDVINALKSYRKYMKLRDEEFILKIALKAKVEQVISNLHALERLLPKTTIRPKKTKEEENQIMREIDLSLEEEIDMIKKKLEKLR